jgi:hypothetical protein
MQEQIPAKPISNNKLQANRKNSLKSTGPRTAEGKAVSRLNSLKHGLLSREIVIQSGEGSENGEEYNQLLCGLRQDLEPVGMLEEMLVEKIAICIWRLARVLRCENAEIRRNFAFKPSILDLPGPLEGNNPELDAIRSHLSLPHKESMDRLMRYESSNNRQLFQAINQLERLQRQRKGDLVPAPISVEVSGQE